MAEPNGSFSKPALDELRAKVRGALSETITAEARRMSGTAEDDRLDDIELTEHESAVVKGVLASVVKAVGQELGEISQRLDALEKRKGLAPLAARLAKVEARQYEGIWRAGRTYVCGCEVTHQGTVWHCADTNMDVRPGTSDTWQMKVKTKGQR